MTSPSTQQIDSFFHGMNHALKIAEKNKRGCSSKQANAIRKEITTLSLLKNISERGKGKCQNIHTDYAEKKTSKMGLSSMKIIKRFSGLFTVKDWMKSIITGWQSNYAALSRSWGRSSINLWALLGEFIAALTIITAPFWGSWLYYVITEEYLQF